MYLYPFLTGFGTSFGLIVAIGAQNAYLLKQGLLRNHILILATLCALIDSALILLGVNGLGTIFQQNHLLLESVRYGGIAFLLTYSMLSFRNAFKTEKMSIERGGSKISLKKNVLNMLAISFFNPHVYIDTCLLIGSISTNFEEKFRNVFALGAILASLIWFYSIAYFAKFLSKYFKNPKAWTFLDIVTGIVMLIIASMLFFAKI